VVTAASANINATASESFTPSQLFSASDAEGTPILSYLVEDESSGSSQGFWVLNGAVLPSGQITGLTAAQLSELSFVAGASAGGPVADTLEVAASDAAGFGPFTSFTVTATQFAPGDVAPVMSATDALLAPNLRLPASSLFGASVPQGEMVVSYEVEDTTTDSGNWVLDGVVEPTNQLLDVTAAQLAQLQFQTGYGTDTLMVRANDGSQWGSFTTFTVTPPPNPAPPAGTSAEMVMERGYDGAYEFYDLGSSAVLLDGPLAAIDPALALVKLGDFNGTDTSDLLMRNSSTGEFWMYDVANNNVTAVTDMGNVGLSWNVLGFGDFSGNAGETDMLMQNSANGELELYDISNGQFSGFHALGPVGSPWAVADFADFSGNAGETDMLMRNSATGEFELYDIADNQLTAAHDLGNVGTSWSILGFGDFSGNAGETDMLMQNAANGELELYDISNNQFTGFHALGPVGSPWVVAGFGDFSGNAGETDMLMRNSATGEFELYDISNNQITAAHDLGNVGLDWSVVGFGDFSGNPNETDMLMRSASTGNFELYDIANSTIVSATALGNVGTAWQVSGITANPSVSSSNASNQQLVQAMATVAPAAALNTSSAADLSTPDSAAPGPTS
jgi:hypothetical protein